MLCIYLLITSFLKIQLKNCYIDFRNKMDSIKAKKFDGVHGKFFEKYPFVIYLSFMVWRNPQLKIFHTGIFTEKKNTFLYISTLLMQL